MQALARKFQAQLVFEAADVLGIVDERKQPALDSLVEDSHGRRQGFRHRDPRSSDALVQPAAATDNTAGLITSFSQLRNGCSDFSGDVNSPDTLFVKKL